MPEEPKHFISSSQIQEIEAAFDRIRGGINLKPKHPRPAEFAEICVSKGGLKAATAIDILLDDADCNGVLKNFIFSALCGWVIDPRDDTISQLYLALEAKKHFLRSELLFETDAEQYTLGLDAICRYTLAGEDFHSEIFFPMGGNENILTSGSMYDVEDYLSADIAAIRSLVYVSGIICHMFHFTGEGKHKPSKNRVLAFVSEAHTAIKAAPVGRQRDFPDFLQNKSKINEIWSRNKESIALLYAAANVRVKRSTTLLDAILNAEVDSERDSALLHEWLGKARFLYDTYLSLLGETGKSSIMEAVSPKVAERRFRLPPINSKEEFLVRQVLLKKN